MVETARLGGFKVLKDVARISLASPKGTAPPPARLFQLIAEQKVNLPYLTLVSDGPSWGVNLVLEAGDAEKVSQLVENAFGRDFTTHFRSAVLSIFPHKRNPDISGRLFETFDQQGLEPEALANSPSAISVVLSEEMLNQASQALFQPFSFGAYRTPQDWKLAQKGKEQLYKEVVASYQEQRPGVYGLEYQVAQELLRIKVHAQTMAHVGTSLRGFARLGLDLAFLASSPSPDHEKQILAICLPLSEGEVYKGIIHRLEPDLEIHTSSPVATFSMNGPHFGDRYGIVSELLSAFGKRDLDLLALSCTVASISGVVPEEQHKSAIQTIKACFDVPTVTRRQ